MKIANLQNKKLSKLCDKKFQIIHLYYKRLKWFNPKKVYGTLKRCNLLHGKLTLSFFRGVFGRGLYMSSKWNIKRDFTKNQFLSLEQSKKSIFKKSAVTAVLLSTVTFNLAFANENNTNDSLQKIYHVYIDNNYIGSVSNEEAVSEAIQTKEKEASTQFKGFDIEAGTNVTIIPEKVFSYQTNDFETLEKLQEEIGVETEAYALQVDGQPIVYFKDQKDYEEALRLLKLEFVTEKQLQQYENNASTNELPKLEVDETRINEISIQEDISGKETKVNPAKILTPKEAVKFLQTGTLEKELYKVQEGDVLSKIASKHNLKTSELLDLNPDLEVDSLLQIGQEINVTVEKPLVNVQVVYEKMNIEKMDYAKIVEEDDEMFKGEKVVKQEGSYGKKEVTNLITELNGNRIKKAVTDEKVISEPTNRVVVVGTKVVSSRGTGNFAWPTNGGYISSQMGSRWGEFHRGIDIARPSNYDIKASDNGVVTFTGWDGTYGNKIVIDHNNGYETVYAHLSEIKVEVGQVVPQGSLIGIMGSTGRSTGTHLHFEVHENGSYKNPLSYLD